MSRMEQQENSDGPAWNDDFKEGDLNEQKFEQSSLIFEGKCSVD